MKSAIRLLSFLAVVALGFSCKDEEPQPEHPVLIPAIEDISPKAGLFGMRVVIKGSNFNTVPTENIVKFSYLQAIVVSATENELVVEVPAGGRTGPVTVSVHGNRVKGPSFKYYDLYLVGNAQIGNKNVVKLWHGGLVTSISDWTGYSYSSAFTVSGDDVFVAGNRFTGTKTIPVYWKNKELHPLNEEANGVATDIAVNGEDVYVSGIELIGTKYVAKYWNNGLGINLPVPAFSNNDANSIDVMNNEVYVGGAEAVSENTSVATYWKDGVKTTLGDAGTGVIDIRVVGSDVYAVGNGMSGFTQHVTYWKNGIAKDLTDGTYKAGATSVTVSGNNVYVAGYEHNDRGIPIAKVWDVSNNIVISPTDEKHPSIAMGVAIVDNVFFVSGFLYDGRNIPFYKVDDEFFLVTGMGQNVTIAGMFLR